MKKMLLAVLAVMMTLTLAGCGDETDKAMKKFVPAKFTSEKESESGIEGVYCCDGKEFLKKTNGYLGRSNAKVIEWWSKTGEKEIELSGWTTITPADAETVYVDLKDSWYYFRRKNDTVKDIDENAIQLGGIWGINVRKTMNEKKEDYIPVNCIPEYSQETNDYNIIEINPYTGILGIFGTIDGKKAIVDKEHKLIWYECDNFDRND